MLSTSMRKPKLLTLVVSVGIWMVPAAAQTQAVPAAARGPGICGGQPLSPLGPYERRIQ